MKEGKLVAGWEGVGESPSHTQAGRSMIHSSASAQPLGPPCSQPLADRVLLLSAARSGGG